MVEIKDSGNLEKVGLRKKRRLRKSVKTGMILVSFLAVVYFGGVIFFNYHYLSDTVIDGNDFSLKTAGQAEEFLRDKTDMYTLRIIGRENTEDLIRADEIDIRNIFDGSLQEIISGQNKFGWIFSFWQENEYHIENLAEYNIDKLESKLKQLKVFDNAREPRDAYIGEFTASAMQYPMVEEDKGTLLMTDKVREAVGDALASLNTEINLDELQCYKEPEVTSENPDLRNIITQLNSYVGAKIIYDWHGIEEIVDGNIIKDWLTVEGESVEIDEGAVRDYINGLSRKHDMFGRKRTFRTAKGEEIELEGGDYGWRVNRSEETEELTRLIKQRAVVKREPIYLYTAYHKGEDDIGNSYVEIDLTNQHLYLFIDGERTLESDFVSGNISRGFGTPTGIYGLTYKERNATLKGENYASKVSYWMPFNGNVGMHDAGWRNKFGGEIYRRNGSHGCINLPADIAETIYSYVEKNFPVICYNNKEEETDHDRDEIKQETEPEHGSNMEPQAGEPIGTDMEGAEQPAQGTDGAVGDITQQPEGTAAPDGGAEPEGNAPEGSIQPEGNAPAEGPVSPEEAIPAGQPEEIPGTD